MTNDNEKTEPEKISDNKIDLKAPGVNKNMLFYAIIALVCAGVIGVVYVKKTSKKTTEQKKQWIEQRGMDPDFFNIDEEEEKKEKKESIKASRDIERQFQERRKKKASKKKVKKENFFISYKQPEKPDTSEIDEFNASRRGKVEIKISKGGKLFLDAKEETGPGKKTIWKNKQKKWDEPQEKASYPVNLARVLTIDKFMAAILVNEINSELGGKVLAQFEENVYGAHGRYVLIPAGSKAIGRYRPIKKIGQERISISWVRIITPDGINIHTGNAEMTDAMGRAGITGDIDRRYSEKYGISLLVSILTAATTYKIPVENTNQQIAVESFGKEQSSLAKTILDEHMNIKPRVTVPAGSRILITATKDIWFSKPKKKIIKIKVAVLEKIEK